MLRVCYGNENSSRLVTRRDDASEGTPLVSDDKMDAPIFLPTFPVMFQAQRTVFAITGRF